MNRRYAKGLLSMMVNDILYIRVNIMSGGIIYV